MEKIGKILETVIQSLSLDKQFQGWKAVSLWDEAVGEKIAKRTKAVSFREGKLVVEVTTAVWMKELTYLRQNLVKKLNESIGEERVKEIVLRRG